MNDELKEFLPGLDAVLWTLRCYNVSLLVLHWKGGVMQNLLNGWIGVVKYFWNSFNLRFSFFLSYDKGRFWIWRPDMTFLFPVIFAESSTVIKDWISNELYKTFTSQYLAENGNWNPFEMKTHTVPWYSDSQTFKVKSSFLHSSH